MKMLDVTIKDVTRNFRSAFAVAFMLGVPILITGMFYLMFGGTGGDDAGFSIPTTKVQIVNQDQGLEGATEMGEMVVALFQEERIKAFLDVEEVADPASARAAVDAQEVGVAILIPENLTAAVYDAEGEARATITLYQDPTLTLGPNVVKAIVRSLLDGFSSTRIALSTVNQQLADADLVLDADQQQALVGRYVQWVQGQGAAQTGADAVAVVPPPGKEEAASTSMVASMLGLIQTGMMIFYAFYTGTAGAQQILEEEEKWTLPRLFTTPTSVTTILSGKFLAIALTILIQVVVLVLFGSLVFGINYGDLSGLVFATVGLMVTATSFGIFVMSLVKETRQAGVIYGGVVTLTGMLGMVNVFTLSSPNAAKAAEKIALVVPQGWAMRVWQLVMDGASVRDVLLPFGVLLLWGIVFFIVGRARFHRRYA